MSGIAVYPERSASTPSSVLGYVETAANGADITAETQILSVTVFVPANRKIRVTGHVGFDRTVTDGLSRAVLREDGNLIQLRDADTLTAGNGAADVSPEIVRSPTSGVHTYTLHFSRITGTGTTRIVAGAGFPTYLLVEDITGGTGGTGPILLDYKQNTTSTPGFTALADIPNLSCTVNVPAGRALKLTGKMQVQCVGGAGDIYVPFMEGATALGRVTYIVSSDGHYHNPMGSIIVYPSPGTHTYRLQLSKYAGSGSAVLAVNADNPAYLMVEDVTGTEAPTGAYYEALWTPVTAFLNGWVNYGAPYPSAAYRKINEMLFIRGLVKSGTTTNTTSILQLPVGYRPAWTHHVATVSNDVATLVRVQNDGNVTVGPNASASWFSLDGIAIGLGA